MESRFQEWWRALPADLRQALIVPYDGENRFVTVVFACMSAAPPAATVADDRLLRALADALSIHGGRIDRFVGDTVLAVFGTPTAHEDDPERALLAAMRLREMARPFGVTVTAGISTGRVHYGSLGEDAHHEITVMGPVTGHAARLQSMARPGELLIAESTRAHVLRAFELTTLPPEPTRSGERMAAYRVERRLDRPQKRRGIDGLRAELVGRDDELARMMGALADVRGGSGRMVAVIGEAGVGKSRLAAELRERAQSGGAPPLWLEGGCTELGVSVAYKPFIDMLAGHLGLTMQADQRSRGRRLSVALRELTASGALSADRSSEMGPLLGRLLSVRFGTEWDGTLEHAPPEQVSHQTVLAIRDLLLGIARRGPVVLVLDDLHWADTLSIDVVSLLMESLSRAAILLLCMYRPEHEQRSWQLAGIAARTCADRSMVIPLKELTPEQSRRLIRSLLAADVLPEAVRESILVQSQGNPFFVEEVIRSLIESGVVSREAGRWIAQEDAPEVVVPDSLQSVILSRVDRLEPRLKRVLEAASIIGRSFPCPILKRVCGDQEHLEESLVALEERALICREKEAADEGYSFRHVLAQQAVYQSIMSRRRGILHGKVAEAMEALSAGTIEEHCEQLAFHNERAGNTDAAIGFLLRAGEKARNAYLNEGALAHLQRALSLLDASGTPANAVRFQVLHDMGRVYEAIGRHDLAETRLREALEVGRASGLHPRDLVPARYLLCKTLTARHRPQEYLPLARENLDTLSQEPDCPEALGSEFVTAYAAFDQGDFGQFCEFAERRGSLIRAMDYSQEMAINNGFLAWAYFIRKDEARALEWLEWLEREASGHNDLLILAAVHLRRGRDLFAQRGDHARAQAEIDQAIRLYDKVGARYLEARAHLCAGDVLYRFGALDDAERERVRAAALCSALEQHEHLSAENRLLAGQIALSRGRSHEAIASFEAALGAAPGEQWEWLLRYLQGCAYAVAGDRAHAARSFTNVLGATLAFRVPPAYCLTIDLAHVLSVLEEYSTDAAFRSACELVLRKRPQSVDLLSRWRLSPAQAAELPRDIVREDFSSALSRGWAWTDPLGDCGYRTGEGLCMRARVGRGLRAVNLSAPRVLRRVSGDWAAETACHAGPDARPSVGGLLLWKDDKDYLRLERGSMAPGTVSLQACICNGDVTIGRGRLDGYLLRLRLERRGTSVRSLCRVEGGQWQLVGETEFAAADPLWVGVFVDGALRPEIYPLAYGGGSEVVFESIHLSAPLQ